MTIVKELNELAERMTGTNPKATTDAMAMNYIEQNYNGGGSGKSYVIDVSNELKTYSGEEINTTIEDEERQAIIDDIQGNYKTGEPILLKFEVENTVKMYAQCEFIAIALGTFNYDLATGTTTSMMIPNATIQIMIIKSNGTYSLNIKPLT